MTIKYKLYDLLKPHCKKAKPYRDVAGTVRWKCRHE